MVVIITAVIAASAFAQSARVTAAIPFDFYVSDRLLPAGNYTVDAQSGALRLSDGRGNSVFVMTTALTENRAIDSSRLVFRRYGGSSFLATVYWQGYKSGREVASSKMEKKLAQNTPALSPLAVQLK